MRLNVERLSTFWPSAEPLLRLHWEEVGKAHDRPFKFDLEQAARIDSAGMGLICTARAINNDVVGYCIWYLGTNLLSAGVRTATQSGWFVHPAWRARGAGLRLFRFAMDELRQRGVQDVYPHYWVGGEDRERIGEWFKKLGATPLENVFHLRLAE